MLQNKIRSFEVQKVHNEIYISKNNDAINKKLRNKKYISAPLTFCFGTALKK